MLALVASPIGRDIAIGVLVLLIIGALYAYWQWSQSQIATLTANLATVQQQANDLATAKAVLQQQMAQIVKDQNAANLTISKAEAAAAQASAALRAAQAGLQAKGKSNPRGLEKQVNKDQQQSLKDLEDLTK